MLRRNFPEHRQAKRERAEAMAQEQARRTPNQQLQRLDARLGKNQGATKEKARLLKLIAQETGAS